MEETNDNELDTRQTLLAPTKRVLANQPESIRADPDERREKDHSKENDDESVDREISRIKARLNWLNWIEFCLRNNAQRH